MSHCAAENKNGDVLSFWRFRYERTSFKAVREKKQVQPAHNDHWVYLIFLMCFLQLTPFKSWALQQADAVRRADLTGIYSGVGLGAQRCSPHVEQPIDARVGIAKNRSAKRPVTVVDAIEMTKVGDPRYSWGRPIDEVAQFSPNGEEFIVVVRKGNVAENSNEYSILLWRTAEIFRGPTPDKVLTMSSSSNLPAIEDVRWVADNKTIVFIGERPGDVRQIYMFDLDTRILSQVTRSPTNVTAFTMDQKGKQFAYTAELPDEPLWTAETARDGVIVTTQWLDMLITGKQQSGWSNDAELYLQSVGQTQRAIRLTLVPDGWGKPFLSPDGQYIIIDLEVDTIPEDWKNYTDPKLQEWTRWRLIAGQHSFLRRFWLIDTKTREGHVLLDAPVVSEPQVTWASDSKSAIIANTYIPVGSTTGADREARRSKVFTVEATVLTGVLTRINPGDQTLISQMPWQRRDMGEGKRRIVLVESMNDPPKLFAVDNATRRLTLLLDLNPQFENLRFAKVEEITWGGSDGHLAKGGLYYPVDYAPGIRYPLVIQTHAWQSNRFWIDGPWTTAFAAQPLAGKNIMVLQADESYDDFDTLTEERREVATFEGAIDELDRRGLIDRGRVGIIGFSRTGDFVANALVFSAYHFAAAAVQDGVDGGYMSYMAFVNANVGDAESETIFGSYPFGDGLEMWLKNSSAFHLDRVHTPLRLLAPHSKSLLSQWAWFAGLRRLGKPVEMVLMRDAAHILEKPADRMVSQGGNVDWFCFWLKGEEDPDLAKKEQYRRWRELRKLQTETTNEAATAVR